MMIFCNIISCHGTKVVPSIRYLPETPFVTSEEAMPRLQSMHKLLPDVKLFEHNITLNQPQITKKSLLNLKKSRSKFFGYRNAVTKRNPNKSRQWSSYRLWSLNPIQHLFFVEKKLNGKAYYEVVHQKPTIGEYFDLTFYNQPKQDFSFPVYICKSEGYIKRWALMMNKCNAGKGWKPGYTAYVSNWSAPNSVKAWVSGNDGVGMPYGTRLSMEKPCCKQKDSHFSYEPCCHYKWWPKDFYMPQKVDSWDSWTKWSKCNVSCGVGQKFRRRKCSNSPCIGDGSEVVSCSLILCPVSKWSEWTAWGECSRTCGYGVMQRTRICESGNCVGSTVDRERCNESECQDKPIWSLWSSWTECPSSCAGKSMSYRTRTCSGSQCSSDKMKQAKPCPKCQTGWSTWSKWSICSVKCGTGVQQRSRSCRSSDTKQCEGLSIDKSVCNKAPCYIPSLKPGGTLGDKLLNRVVGKRPSSKETEIEEYGKYEFDKVVSKMEGSWQWGPWGSWEPCSKTCGTGLTWRKKECRVGSCLAAPLGAREVKTCRAEYCHGWSVWAPWTECSRSCGEGMKSRIRICDGGVAGHGGCLGPKFSKTECNTAECLNKDHTAEFVSSENNGPIPYNPTPYSLNYFEQSCIDYHNFFRSLHNIEPLLWNPEMQQSAQKWADYLAMAAPEHPLKILPGYEKSEYWPHSDSDSTFRSRGVGENIAWDFSQQGSPCSESVYRWYSEYFYFDETSPMQSRRGAEPVGHLTQLLWHSTEAVGCAVANVWIPNKPGYVGDGMTSSYTVCHYSPQGNIIGLEKDNWRPKKKELCATYDVITGKSDCGEAGSCMGLSDSSKCGCGYAQGNKLPRCTGHCIVQCWNVWGSRNFWPQECMGESLCTCNKDGAVCK